jgi:FAD/FMN-containing dehydrogenase
MQGCNCHLEFNLKYDPENHGEADSVRQLVENGSEALAEMGGFFSRPYGAWNRFAYDKEGQQAIGLRKIKEIFDANGILNPGKLCY